MQYSISWINKWKFGWYKCCRRKCWRRNIFRIKKKLVEELRSKLEEAYSYSGTVEELADLCGIDLNDTTAGEITSSEGKIIKIDDNTTIVLGFEMKCETGSKSQYITDDNTDGRYTEMKISNIKVVKIQEQIILRKKWRS